MSDYGLASGPPPRSSGVLVSIVYCECYSRTSHCNRNGATASRKEDLLSGGWRFKEERFWRDP